MIRQRFSYYWYSERCRTTPKRKRLLPVVFLIINDKITIHEILLWILVFYTSKLDQLGWKGCSFQSNSGATCC